MSTFVALEVECPSCGTRTQRMVATSINASRSPEWRAAILDGSFQRSSCATCGEVATPIIAFPYIDFDRKQYIGVFPADDEVNWPQLEREPADAYSRNLGERAPQVAQAIGEGFEVRTVFGLGALREKIVALSAGIDDGALEALKLRLFIVRDDLSASLDGRPRLVDVDHLHLRFNVVRAGADGGWELFQLDVPRADFDAITTDPDVEPLIAALRAGPYRDCGRMLEPAVD